MPAALCRRRFATRIQYGIVVLAILAGAILAAFGGSVTNLVPLYTIGVFLAFTLSQSGLVRRWRRLRNPGWQLSMVINTFGALVTGTVLVVVAVTKFEHGAWMVMVLIPVISAVLYGIHRHYQTVQDALVIAGGDHRVPVFAAPSCRAHRAPDRAALQAWRRALDLPAVKAVHISTSKASAEDFRRGWAKLDTDIRSSTWSVSLPVPVASAPQVHRRAGQVRRSADHSGGE